MGDRTPPYSSWPGLARPSTSFFFRNRRKKPVDGPNKSGHDGFGLARACAAIGIAFTVALPASAQDWKAAWDKTVAAANEEGSVVILSQPNVLAREFIQREWPKAYPKIAVSLSVVPTGQFFVRIRTERAADKFLWDLGFSGSSVGYVLSREGTIDPFAPELVLPEVNDEKVWGGWDEAYVDLARKYVFSMSSYIRGPWYNAAFVSPEKVERLGLKILLEPEYKGKTVWHYPLQFGTGQTQALLLQKQLGPEGFKTLLTEQAVQMVPQQQMVVEAMARGVAWIGLGAPVKGLIAPYLQAGVKADIRSFGNRPEVNIASIGGSALYVFNKRPHPNAARVFINWILSKNIQAELGKILDQDTRRTDVPRAADADEVPAPGVKYMATQREEYVKEQEDVLNLIKELRAQRP
jgi:iron(III) transport system substrate-binding protein